MKVTIPISFEVMSLIEDDDLTDSQAEDAATQAAYHYLAFEEVKGFGSTEVVKVHLDGFGKCSVKVLY